MKAKSDHHINVFHSVEDGGYIADVPDLKSCSAFGETPEEALRAAPGARGRLAGRYAGA